MGNLSRGREPAILAIAQPYQEILMSRYDLSTYMSTLRHRPDQRKNRTIMPFRSISEAQPVDEIIDRALAIELLAGRKGTLLGHLRRFSSIPRFDEAGDSASNVTAVRSRNVRLRPAPQPTVPSIQGVEKMSLAFRPSVP